MDEQQPPDESLSSPCESSPPESLRALSEFLAFSPEQCVFLSGIATAVERGVLVTSDAQVLAGQVQQRAVQAMRMAQLATDLPGVPIPIRNGVLELAAAESALAALLLRVQA